MTILKLNSLLLAAALVATTVQAQQNPNTQDAQQNQQNRQPGQADQTGQSKDQTFVKEALQGNLLEIRLGNMAQQKGSNSQVKQFGEKLVREHGEAYNKLKQIAQTEGVQWSQQLDPKHQSMLDEIQNKSGDEYDKEFAKHMVKSHVKGVAKYQRASTECQSQELKTYAQKTLPTLRQHLTEAKDLARSVGLDDATIASLTREAEEAAGTPGAGIQVGGERKESDRIDTPKDRPNQPDKSNEQKP